MQAGVRRRRGPAGEQPGNKNDVQHHHECHPNPKVSTAKRRDHTRLLVAFHQRPRSSGQSAAAPGMTISRKPRGACSATGSMRRMPNRTKAIAKTAPANPYTASASTKNSAACMLRLLPVNRNGRSCDLRAGVGGEMNQDRSHLRGLYPLRAVCLRVAGAIARSIHRPRQDGIGGDAAVLVLQRDRADQRNQGSLGSAVRAHHRSGFDRLPAGNREDPPAALPPHLGQHGPRDKERGAMVEIEHFFERRVDSLVDAGSARETSHHVHQRVDAAEAGDGILDELTGGIAAGKLRRHGGELRVREVARLNGARHADYPGSGSQERFRDECAEPALGAGDEYDLPFECVHGSYSPDDHATRNSGYRVSPPHAKIVCPVTYEASSEARNAKTAAISHASAARLMGMWLSTSPRALGLSIHALLIGVTTAPGPTALTRMPWPAYSSASDLVRFSMPPLLTEYGRYFGFGIISCTLELLRMTPPLPRERKCRMASRAQRNAPRRFTPRTRSKSVTSIS